MCLRGWGGLGIYFLSWLLGFWVWLWSLAYAISVSIFWAVVGVFIGGIGVVPVAGIMTLFRRDWIDFGELVGMVAAVWLLRALGLWIASKAEEAELKRTLLTETTN